MKKLEKFLKNFFSDKFLSFRLILVGGFHTLIDPIIFFIIDVFNYQVLTSYIYTQFIMFFIKLYTYKKFVFRFYKGNSSAIVVVLNIFWGLIVNSFINELTILQNSKRILSVSITLSGCLFIALIYTKIFKGNKALNK